MNQALFLLAISAAITGSKCSDDVGNTASNVGRTEPTGVVANMFDLNWELVGSDLMLSIDTDLPGETEVIVSLRRSYYEVGNSESYARDYFEERSLISRWREPRQIAIDDEAWKADLKAHQDEMARISSDLAFEIETISNEIEIRAVVHTNQPDPRFRRSRQP